VYCTGVCRETRKKKSLGIRCPSDLELPQSIVVVVLTGVVPLGSAAIAVQGALLRRRRPLGEIGGASGRRGQGGASVRVRRRLSGLAPRADDLLAQMCRQGVRRRHAEDWWVSSVPLVVEVLWFGDLLMVETVPAIVDEGQLSLCVSALVGQVPGCLGRVLLKIKGDQEQDSLL